MKKIYILLLLLPAIVLGQNYQTIQPELEVYFEPDTLIQNPMDLFVYEGVLLRSLYMMPAGTAGEGSYYASFNEIHNDDYSSPHWFGECVDSAKLSWIGNYVLIKDNGMNVFFNRENDSIYIHTLAALNESFLFYAYSDGSHFLATVTAHENMEFLGITVNVKTLTLQLYDAGNTPVNSPLNGTEIMLTENFGFYKTINFRDFPEFVGSSFSVVGRTLFGHGNIENSFHKMTMRDVYDFEVGDLYHYTTDWNGAGAYWWEKQIIEILEKEWLQNDQVKYTCREEAWGYAGPAPYYNMYYHIDTVEKVYSDIDTLVNDQLPFKPYFKPTGDYDLLTYDLIQTDLYNERPVLITSNDGYNYLPYLTCYSIWWFDSGNFNADYYIKGCGKLTTNETIDSGEIYYGFSESMAYYKKGEEEWGTPLEPPIIGMEEYTGRDHTLLVYPNPTEGEIYFSTKGLSTSEQYSFKLYDQKGTVLIDKLVNPNELSIDLSDLKQGLYFYRVVGADLNGQGKVLVK